MKKILIPEKIKRYRKENAMTQADFGCIMGVSAQAVSKWENETCYPDITFLPALAEVLGCGIEELFGAG